MSRDCERIALISLGSNLSNSSFPPAEVVRQAISRLQGPGWGVLRASRLYRTPAFPPGSGPDYVNAAVSITFDTPPDPDDLLARLHDIESLAGRERQQRWGARTLDLDLLALGSRVLPDDATQDRWRTLDAASQTRVAPDRLILPHPRLQDRSFVLVSLADVAPDWVHPRLGLTVAAMLDALPLADRQSVTPL